MTDEEMIKGYRKSLRQMTNSLYHRQLESIKLASIAPTDLVDMLRERDKRIEKLEKENGKLEGKLTKAKEIIRALLKHTHGQNLNTQNDFDLYLGRSRAVP